MRFLQPGTLEEAISTRVDNPEQSVIIAGGTAVVLMLQHGLIAPEVLISLEKIPGLDSIRIEDNRLHIGALAKLGDVADSRLVRQYFPALFAACAAVGNVRVRNQATLGGNLAEADYASDPPAALMMLDALVEVKGISGTRQISLPDLLLGFLTTTLEPDELITGVIIPIPTEQPRMAYLRYNNRSSEDRPCVGIAASATFNDAICTGLRLTVGAACEIPTRLSEIEALAVGSPLTDTRIHEIAEGYAAGIETIDDLQSSAWYRTQMIRVHIQRVLKGLRDG
ncbi:MAG: FAD binding domain-containing protein [Chloroflexi bacterium]|nr:FAD binding domain-containing protein [Chloroflexota bacterium]